ncbi:UDP-N-acetylglucosamine 2-epimerase (non-hydrolyzing) [Candidatus Micrarchaeota archaeon]|nr:UDP-N-acetylglucosamine 2-epimerase (non-hydrolyzing) [Candidatus Micrarchaeota archaeon]
MIGIVLGTRPEVIKLAPVIWELRKRKAAFKVIHTGQHYDYNMSKIFFEQLDLGEPDCFLNAGSDSDARQTAKMMVSLEDIFTKDGLKTIVVEGDTNSVLAGAIVAKKMMKTLAHVEAGARSFDKTMPEEVNRIVCDHLSDVLFAPNEFCLKNLVAENVSRERIMLSGNTQFAAMNKILEKTRGLKFAFVVPKKFVLVTVHRQENTTPEKLVILAKLLASIDGEKLFVLHPRTRAVLVQNRLESEFKKAGVIFLEPQGYAEILHLADRARAVLTDSGGLQKEAAALGKPVLIPRTATEWPDIVESGHARLIGLTKESAKPARKFLSTFNPKKLKKIREIEGNPAKKIVDRILSP